MANKKRNDQYNIDDLLQEESCDYLTEESFYPPSDNRVWKSYVEDIDGGENFADHCRDFFELLEEEGYYD